MADRETLDVYNAKAKEYADRFGSVRADLKLVAFIEALPTGGHVLDLGCGPGFSAAEMARNGLRVTATDASTAMVELAAQHQGVDAICTTFDEIEGSELYDGVWANFSLLHAKRNNLPDHLNTLARVLKPHGLMHIGMKTGTGEARDGIGRHYIYVTPDELEGLLRDAGMAPISQATGEEPGLDGTVSPWVTILSRKSSND